MSSERVVWEWSGRLNPVNVGGGGGGSTLGKKMKLPWLQYKKWL